MLVASGELDQLGHDRVAAGDDQGIGPQDVEHPWPRAPAHGAGDRVDPRPQLHGQHGHGVLAAGKLTDPRRDLQDFAEAVGAHEVDGDAEPTKLIERLLTVARVGGHDEIGAEGHDGLEARPHHPSHAALAPGLGREIAVVGDADEAVFRPQREDDFGHAGNQRDDPRRRRRQHDVSAEHVDIGEGGRGPDADEHQHEPEPHRDRIATARRGAATAPTTCVSLESADVIGGLARRLRRSSGPGRG